MCIKFDAWWVIASFYYDYLEDITKIGKQILQEMERYDKESKSCKPAIENNASFDGEWE